MGTETVQQKQTPEEAVRAANNRFYAAFESLDVAEMEAVWSHDDGVECVLPGWDLLLGWDEVRERWSRIFANAKRVRIALGNVWVQLVTVIALTFGSLLEGADGDIFTSRLERKPLPAASHNNKKIINTEETNELEAGTRRPRSARSVRARDGRR